MKILKYILIIALLLPANIMLACECGPGAHSGSGAPRSNTGGGSAGSQGFAWGKFAEENTSKILVSAAGAAVTAIAGALIKEWLNPSEQNDSILKRDKALENTRQHVQDLRRLAASTNNPELKEQCLKSAEFGEALLAQGIAFRNESFAKLCGNSKNSF